jgi:succinate dehydrogenase / fumarate reductase, cytochrome b subunit
MHQSKPFWCAVQQGRHAQIAGAALWKGSSLLCRARLAYIQPASGFRIEGMAEPQGRAAGMKMERPLSPHLQVYRLTLTMFVSISNRIAGGALYVGTLFLVWYLVALASGPDTFASASWFFDSIIGRLVMLGLCWALFHHMLGGVRHFIWDTGRWMDHPEREWLAMGTLAGGIVLTLIVAVLAFAVS